MAYNPYREDSQAYKVFNLLSDREWHCSICELTKYGSQPAATIRDLRRKGYEVLSAAQKGGDEPARYCNVCKRKTTHYKLAKLEITLAPKVRAGLPNRLKSRLLRIYDQREALTRRKRHPKDLTVDHRIPAIRWKEKEKEWGPMISDKELIKTFQLLTNEDNLWKSRMCETCKQTGKRQPFLNIHYFYEGNKNYNEKLGCVGCGWYNPEKWREKLNLLIRKILEQK